MPTRPDASTAPDAAVAPDAALPVCPARDPGEVGGPCTAHADCDSADEAGDGFCLTSAIPFPILWPEVGYCILACDEDQDCGAGNFCAVLDEGDEENDPVKYCVPACCDLDTCQDGHLCTDDLYGLVPLGGDACVPGNADAVDGDACAGFYECNASSLCRSDPFEIPGGMCQTMGCTVGDDTTCAPGGDGRCVMAPGVDVPVCVHDCEVDADCRESEGYRCLDGTAQGLGTFCGHRRVGDPCGADTDCGTAPPWGCLQTADYPAGYCTIPGCTVGDGSTCPFGSICFDPDDQTADDEYCVRRCNPELATPCPSGQTCAVVHTTANEVDLYGCIPEE